MYASKRSGPLPRSLTIPQHGATALLSFAPKDSYFHHTRRDFKKKFITQSWRQRSRTRSFSVREANKDLFLTQYQHWNKAWECSSAFIYTHKFTFYHIRRDLQKKIITKPWRRRSRSRSFPLREASKDLSLTPYQHYGWGRHGSEEGPVPCV